MPNTYDRDGNILRGLSSCKIVTANIPNDEIYICDKEQDQISFEGNALIITKRVRVIGKIINIGPDK